MTTAALAVDADLERLRGEFLAMPGLRLTIRQAARLLSVCVEMATATLAALEDEGFLIRGAGVYRRSSPPMA